jgi:hypothetical protein
MGFPNPVFAVERSIRLHEFVHGVGVGEIED